MALNPVSTFAVPSPYEQQMLEAKRRQQLAEMLQEQAGRDITPQQGKIASKINPLAGVAQMLSAGLAGYNRRQADEAQLSANLAAQAEIPDFLNKLNQGSVTPDNALAAALAQGGSNPATAPSRQDMIQRLATGSASSNPYIKQLSGAMLPAYMKANDTKYEGGIKFTGEGLPYMVSTDGSVKFLDPKVFTPRDTFSTETAEGKASRKQSEEHWSGLSAAQEAELRQRQRSGEIDAQRLRDETGVYVPPVTRPQVPTQSTNLASALQRTAPAQGAKIPVQQPVAPVAAPPIAGLSPKQQREVTAERGKAQREAQAALPDAETKAMNAVALIDKMLGTNGLTRDEINARFQGAEKAAHPGFENYVGATWLPFASYIPGTDAAGFKALEGQLKGQSFLEAFQTLKGGGQITEVEGAKATAAINRMDKATSEAEYIEAARDFQRNVILGLEKAKAKAEGRPAPTQGFKQQYSGVTKSDW